LLPSLHRPFPTSLEGRPGGAAVGFASSRPELEAAQRWKRVAGGQALLATDLFHQHLLTGLGDRAELPAAWRSPRQWAELVRCGTVDAVLLQTGQGEKALQGSKGANQLLAGSLACVDLGRRPLVLVCKPPAAGGHRHSIPPLRLLAPPRAAAMELHQALEDMQLAPLMSCASTSSIEWITQLEQGDVLLPVPAELLLQPPWQQAQLTAVPAWEPLWEQLDLLVPSALLECSAIQELTQTLRQRLAERTAGWLA
jgi:hypothetical protein